LVLRIFEFREEGGKVFKLFEKKLPIKTSDEFCTKNNE